MAFLEVKNLSHYYGQGTPFKTDAVHNVSFSAEKGEIIGIIGHTGSGKSTLIQHLNGLLKADEGQVLIDGKDIWENPKEINKIRFRVGMVFQYPEHQLFDETVYKDIAFGPTNMNLNAEEVDKAVRYSASLVGIGEEFFNKSPLELSGGEMRRVAIAGVIAMRPEILVLDEPTAGLDPAGRELLISRIIEYRNTTNATVFIVSHSMEDIARISDKVLVMNHGELAMFDKTENVFKNCEQLQSIGLNVPQITKIMASLKVKGINLNGNYLTVNDAVEAIVSLKNGGATNA